MDTSKGLFFDQELIQEIKDKFCLVDEDPEYGKRLFFENSGGSLRLKKAVEAKANAEAFPDCPERTYNRSLTLKGYVNDATGEMLEVMFGAKKGEGALVTELTASQAMFKIVGMIMENCEGTNAVVSVLEHPSAFDAVDCYCRKTGREMRVAPVNPATGRIETEDVIKLVDDNTCLISVMSASNVTGAVMDIEDIVRQARAINPDVYVVSDAVQHAPHMKMDVQTTGVDAMNFAPYKFFGVRGCGYAYVSERVARLPHDKLLAKDEKVFELGTPAPGNFAAMLEVMDYVCWLGSRFTESTDRQNLFTEGMRRIHLQERALLYRMLEGTTDVPGLRHIPGVRIAADPESVEGRDLIVGIMMDAMTSTELANAYGEKGVVVADRAADSLYSHRIVMALGAKDGLVRVSPLHCHSQDDVDYFLKVTAEIAGM